MPWYEQTKNGAKCIPGVLADYLAQHETGFFLNNLFYQYEDGVYKEHPGDFAKGIIRRYMVPEYTTKSMIDDVFAQWKMIATKDNADINQNPLRINVQNGLYDVEQDVLLSHTPDYLTTMQLHTTYDPDGDCPKFMQFLTDLFHEDYHPFVQEMMGYLLVPVTKAQKCFLITGFAGSGKSKFLSVIEEILLGRENVSNVSWQNLNQRFMTAQLHNKLANIFADLPATALDDTGLFKALVGEDNLTAEHKFGHPFSFRSTARLIFSCNQIPANYTDRTNGFYRRLCILKCNPPLPEERRNPDLLEELREEGAGILNFALAGLRRLMARNYHFDEPSRMRDALEQYKAQNHSVLLFLRERCEMKNDGRVSSKTLYDAYLQFCEDENAKPFARNKFARELKDVCDTVTSEKDWRSNTYYWKGLSLLE